jgi:peptidoglycan/LPS O-acetylase OafA/YrhL
MNFVRWSMLVYGLALIAMGVQSFFFPFDGGKPSIISLVAAGGMGVIMLLLTFFANKAVNPRFFYIGAIVVALLTSSRFVMTGLSKGITFYPGGLTVVLSVTLIAILGLGHLSAMKKRKELQTKGE